MWQELVSASKFPYAVNSEVEAENILFKNSPERLVLLKWIYVLTSGLLNDISPDELADYFLNLGIVEGDPLKFVEGNSPRNHQKKVWSNLFHFAKMMKYSLEISNNFTEKYGSQMPLSCAVAVEHLSTSTKTESLSSEPGIPNLDCNISTLEEQVPKSVVTSTGENKIILCKLKEFLNSLSQINAKISSSDSVKLKHQFESSNEFGNYTADLCSKMKTLETVLMSSSNVMSSMRQLEKKLDDLLLKNEDNFELVCKLKRLSKDY